VVLTSSEKDHITGLQDIVSRYQIGAVIDGGMLHPNATYALWRRTITEHHLRYLAVSRGTSITVGEQVTLQVLWPAIPLHKGSNETRDNTLVARLIVPGLHMLLVGAAAQSKYALAGLLADFNVNYLQADIVQIVGETGKTVPSELGELVRTAHPSLLVITPAALSTQQRKLAHPSTIVSTNELQSWGMNWQIVQTAQVGTFEISSGTTGWNVNSM
jgi:beta-lactamase superfamily II metal-dependent hydrolase